jgi:sugar phosphate isomerase/epimerase
MNLDHFGMDTITLAGPLEAKLRAIKGAGFTQVMLNATDIVGHPNGEAAAVEAVRASGLRVTGFQVLRDFEGLSGHLHAYKVDVAKAMLSMCRALGSNVLLACSSSSAHASGDTALLVKDLRKLATLAVPLGIKIAYEALSWGRHVNQVRSRGTWLQTDRANLGVTLDAFHILRRRPTSACWTESIRPRCSSCSCRTSCGRKRARRTSGSKPRAITACFRARACTAIKSPTWSAGSTPWAIAATTASKSSTTTTGSSRCRWSPTGRGNP